MEDPAGRRETVHLLWTGGWDSTFRLLDLLLIKGRQVQPYYFIRTARRSFATEIAAMNAVKRRLGELHPDRLPNLRPTIFRDVDEIPADPEISASYERVCAQTHIGIQYEWGARFARAEGISPLELSLIKGGHMFGIFLPLLYQEEIGGDLVCEIDRKNEGTDLYRLFKDYRFPLIMMTKQAMLAKARQHGFEEFLHLTVFCSTPRRDGRPCGLCIPCGIAVEHGLGWRLPPSSRMRRRLQRKFPRLFPLARRIAGAVRNRLVRKRRSHGGVPPTSIGRDQIGTRKNRIP